MSFAISAVSSVFLVVLYLARHKSDPMQPPVQPMPVGPSRFQLCRDIEAHIAQVTAKLGCPPNDSQYRQWVCEVAFTTRRDCEAPLRGAYECAKNAPESAWTCDSAGTLRSKSCALEVKKFADCLQREDPSPAGSESATAAPSSQ